MKELNLLIGKFVCWITKSHRTPLSIFKNHIWRVEYCNRCGKVMKKEKIGRTFFEIFQDEYENSGNQIW